MKCTTIIDKAREEEVLIYAHERTPLVDEIQALATGNTTTLMAYGEGSIRPLIPDDIHAVIVENGKVYALTGDGKYDLRHRLYEVESLLDRSFVKINQSCIGNMSHIARFDVSLGGALMVTFQNGYKDYVSRRQLKIVKERMGIKK